MLIIAFGSPQKAEFIGFFMTALKAVLPDFPPLPMDPPPLPFQLANPDTFQQELVNAGLADVRVETTSWAMHFTSGAISGTWSPLSSAVGGDTLALNPCIDLRKRRLGAG